MTIQEQIEQYITSQPQPKQRELQQLHEWMQQLLPGCRLWFLDGKDESGKTVSNPNIGYGAYTMQYAGGKTREFYQVGISANTGGISVYIMGIDDRKYLADTFSNSIGKAAVSGYCIKFKTLRDIHLHVLEAAVLYGVKVSQDRK